ncbi:MAG: hypothetical protein AAGK04_07985 [Planctomycetota bacterium]
MAGRNHDTMAFWVYFLVAVIGAGVLVFGLAADQLVAKVIGGASLGLAALAASVTGLTARPSGEIGPGVGTLIEEVRQLRSSMDRMTEHSALSDDARRVLNRNRERELLRRAISEDIQTRDWNAAIILCNELADRFGYHADAAEFRKHIERARAQTLNQEVDQAISGLDTLIVQRRWNDAAAAADRIHRLYPESPRTQQLQTRVDRARNEYRRDLERRFLEATHNDRIDEAMELLKELDGYLTEGDAEQYREVARGVIGKARDNLGAQFKMAVHDRQWDTAAIVGQRILDDFPNTRMADEIRSMIDKLRERASSVVG